jgi:FAD/FMN-containing dehydrogenase
MPDVTYAWRSAWEDGGAVSPPGGRGTGVCVPGPLLKCGLIGAAMAVAFGAYHHVRYVAFPATRASIISSNWDGTVDLSVPAADYRVPRSVEEVAAIVTAAASAGRRVKAVGAGHSWSAIAQPERGGLLLSLDGMAAVLRVDAAARQLTVQGGMRIADICQFAAELQPPLALHNVGSVREQSIAGAISTATHGSGLGHGSLSTAVVALQLVDGTGRVRQLALGDEDGDLFGAARAGLGALGIITEVTLQLVDAYAVHYHQYSVSEREVVARLATLRRHCRHAPRADASSPSLPGCGAHPWDTGAATFNRAWIFPHTGKAIMYDVSRAAGGAPVVPGARTGAGVPPAAAITVGSLPLWREEVSSYLATGVQLLVAAIFGWRGPAAVAAQAAVNRVSVDTGLPETVRVGRSDLVQYLAYQVPPHAEAEWGVPAEYAADALEALLAWTARNGTAVAMVYELRCSARDDVSLLSQAFGRDVCHIGVLVAPPTPARMTATFGALEQIVLAYGGRPHFAKRIVTAGPAVLAAQFGPAWRRFAAVRGVLDPAGVFDNAFLRAVLGPWPRPRQQAAAGSLGGGEGD